MKYLLLLLLLLLLTTTTSTLASTLPPVTPPPPSKVIIISRHGVRRQFPSDKFKFSDYAPGKSFATSDAQWGAGGDL